MLAVVRLANTLKKAYYKKRLWASSCCMQKQVTCSSSRRPALPTPPLLPSGRMQKGIDRLQKMEEKGREEPDLGLESPKKKIQIKKGCKIIYFRLETCRIKRYVPDLP
jgi:hypothetical protein